MIWLRKRSQKFLYCLPVVCLCLIGGTALAAEPLDLVPSLMPSNPIHTDWSDVNLEDVTFEQVDGAGRGGLDGPVLMEPDEPDLDLNVNEYVVNGPVLCETRVVEALVELPSVDLGAEKPQINSLEVVSLGDQCITPQKSPDAAPLQFVEVTYGEDERSGPGGPQGFDVGFSGGVILIQSGAMQQLDLPW